MEQEPRKPVSSFWKETEKKAHRVSLRGDGRLHLRKPISSYWGKRKAA